MKAEHHWQKKEENAAKQKEEKRTREVAEFTEERGSHSKRNKLWQRAKWLWQQIQEAAMISEKLLSTPREDEEQLPSRATTCYKMKPSLATTISPLDKK